MLKRKMKSIKTEKEGLSMVVHASYFGGRDGRIRVQSHPG
jgi:hypothetical protein